MFEPLYVVYNFIYYMFVNLFVFSDSVDAFYFGCITFFWFYFLLSVAVILYHVIVAGRLYKKHCNILGKTRDIALARLNNELHNAQSWK